MTSDKLAIEKPLNTSDRNELVTSLIRLNWIQLQSKDENHQPAKLFLKEIRINPSIDSDSLSLIKISQCLEMLSNFECDYERVYEMFKSMEFAENSTLKGHILFLLMVQISNHRGIDEKFLVEILWDIWINWDEILKRLRRSCFTIQIGSMFRFSSKRKISYDWLISSMWSFLWIF